MRRSLFLALGLAAALLLLGCRGPVEGLVGEYEAEGPAGARLTLRPDGGGALSVGAEEAPFRWEIKDGKQLLLHTRQGGILALNLTATGLEGDMPGTGKVVFLKK